MSFRGSVCANGKACEVHKILRSMPSQGQGSLRPLRLSFVHSLRDSTQCVLCHEAIINRTIATALWEDRHVVPSELAYRHLAEPDLRRHLIPEVWMERVGLAALMWCHEIAAWRVTLDKATGTRALQRVP